jgi:hypothetical protein
MSSSYGRRARRVAEKKRKRTMSEKKRYIIDPGPQPIAGFPYTFQVYISHYIRKHPLFNNNGNGIRAAMRIEAATEKPAAFYELRNDDWAMLKEIDSDPGKDVGYPRIQLSNSNTGEVVMDEALPKRVHIAMMDAIADAGTKEPETTDTEEPRGLPIVTPGQPEEKEAEAAE